MLFSKTFIPTQREVSKSAESISSRLLLKGGYLYMVSSGIYTYLPLGLKVLNNISNIIRKYMEEEGAIELLMSALQPIDIWKKTGRDKDLAEVMFRFQDRKGRDLCLGPTHEEEITEIAKKYLTSYRQLPVILYQIQTKFRDEIRPRFGLLRTCEFVMKDAYSFDKDLAGLEESYQKMFSAYEKIFKECGLDFVAVEADPGAMGGDVSHEFMIPAEVGEDILFYCKDCNKYYKSDQCKVCGKAILPQRMIEVGHIFKLKTKYSLAQDAFFLDKDGTRKPFIMGCYGIGVSRLMSAIIEQHHDEKGIVWPLKVAPYQMSIIIVDITSSVLMEKAKFLEGRLKKEGWEILVDDRDESVGVKFNDAYLVGSPVLIVLGKKYLETQRFEIELRKSKKKLILTEEEFFNYFSHDFRG